jgi:hypothetical protein
MPSADAILTELSETANTWRSLAITWHLLLSALLVALLAGWRFSTRPIAWVAIAPILSVSALSWASNNPFNGTVFAALAITLAGATIRTHGVAIELERPWRVIPGAALLMFGWTYPHFLTTDSWTEYLYAAPFGIVPCATLSVVIGLTLMIRNVGTAAWSAPLAAAGVLYGIVGVFMLHVLLDVVLLSGALILAVVVAFGGRTRRSVRADGHERTW